MARVEWQGRLVPEGTIVDLIADTNGTSTPISVQDPPDFPGGGGLSNPVTEAFSVLPTEYVGDSNIPEVGVTLAATSEGLDVWLEAETLVVHGKEFYLGQLRVENQDNENYMEVEDGNITSRREDGNTLTLSSGTAASPVTRFQVDENAITFHLNTATTPAPGQGGVCSMWFDPTDGAPKIKFRGRSSDGTLVNAEIPLT